MLNDPLLPLFLAPALLLPGSTALLSQGAPAPASLAAEDRAATLVAQHLEACGGPERLRAIRSRRIAYRCSGLTPFDFPVVVEQKRPCLYRRESTLLGVAQIEAFDGHRGWKVDPLTTFSAQPLDLTASEARQMNRDATFDTPLLDYAAKGHRVAYVGQELEQGRAMDALRVTFKDGEAMTLCLDARTHLAVKWIATERQKGKDVEITTTLGDYRAVQGMAQPFLIEIAPKDGAWRMKLVAEKVELGPSLDDGRFARPGAPVAVASK